MRRFNHKKIAKQPLIKKKLALFCATIDVAYNEFKTVTYHEILAHGHRGYISYSEDDLAKAFDKRFEFIKNKHEEYLKAKAEAQTNRGYYITVQKDTIETYYADAVELANEIFEEQVLFK